MFARRKIRQELDEITGRKEIKAPRKKQKKPGEVNPSEEIGDIEVNPSEETGDINEKKLPDIYKPRDGLGFFGYIFLLVVICFSFIGMLKTFENDLLYYFPEAEYIYQLLNEQLLYISETFKNIILIISDFIKYY